MSENRKIIKNAALVGFFTTISRILGLLRDMVIAGMFGAGMATDAFFVAFRIPNVLRRLFAEGALTVSFIPIFKEAYARGGAKEAKEVSDIVFTFLSFILAIVVILSIVFAPSIVTLIAGGFDNPEKFELTVYLTRITFPYLFLISLVALAMGVLNSVGHFAAPAAAPVLLNIAIILSAFILGPFLGEPVLSLAIGVVAGGIFQVILQVPVLIKRGYFPSINFDFRNPSLKRLMCLMAPALFGIAVYQLNIFISTIIATYLPEGSVSYLYYADRFFQLPLGIFVVSLATAVLPTMSEQAAEGRLDHMRESLSFSLKVIMFITLPAAAGLLAVSIPVFSLFFQRGKFDYLTTVKTAEALQYYAIGLWAIGGVKIVVPAFYAMQDMKTPVWAAFAAFITNIVFSLILMGPMEHSGLALATTISAIFNLALLVFVIRARVGAIVDGSVVVSFLKSIVSSILTAFVAMWICGFGDWKTDGLIIQKSLLLSAAIAGGSATYITAALVLRSEEAGYVLREINKRLRRKYGKT